MGIPLRSGRCAAHTPAAGQCKFSVQDCVPVQPARVPACKFRDFSRRRANNSPRSPHKAAELSLSSTPSTPSTQPVLSPKDPGPTSAPPPSPASPERKKKTTTPALPTPSGSPRVTGSFVRHAPRPGGASRRQRADVPQLHGPVGRRRGGLVVAGLPDRRLLLVLRRQGIDANRLPWHSWWARKCVSAAV